MTNTETSEERAQALLAILDTCHNTDDTLEALARAIQEAEDAAYNTAYELAALRVDIQAGSTSDESRRASYRYLANAIRALKSTEGGKGKG